MARITSKGQVTIPRATRLALGLHAGSEVEFVVRDGEAIIRKASIRGAIERWAGFLAGDTNGVSTDELVDDLRGPAEL